MRYLPDTNVWISYLNPGESAVKRRFPEHPPSVIALCSVVRAELLYGAYRSTRSEANLRLLGMLFRSFPSLAFDDAAADCYGRIRATLAQQGTPIGPNDLMIAAITLRALAKPIAQAHSLILVTHNSREFSRVAGLQLEDWEDG